MDNLTLSLGLLKVLLDRYGFMGFLVAAAILLLLMVGYAAFVKPENLKMLLELVTSNSPKYPVQVSRKFYEEYLSKWQKHKIIWGYMIIGIIFSIVLLHYGIPLLKES